MAVMKRNDGENGMNWRQNQVDYGVQSADKPWQACENYINLQFLRFLRSYINLALTLLYARPVRLWFTGWLLGHSESEGNIG